MFFRRQYLVAREPVPDVGVASGYARELSDPSLDTPTADSWSAVEGDPGIVPPGGKIGLFLTL